MSKRKGQQVVEHSLFPLEFQLPDGKDVLRTAQRCYQIHFFENCGSHFLSNKGGSPQEHGTCAVFMCKG